VTFLIDTNAVSDLMRADSRIESWLASVNGNDRVVTCPIVRGEILFGIERLTPGKRRTELEQAAHRILALFRCEPVPENAGEIYGRAKATRQQQGARLDENDLWVAATALALGATLVSRDSDFSGIVGLSVVIPR